jgi:DNA-binding CsgD family transcriptional regulator
MLCATRLLWSSCRVAILTGLLTGWLGCLSARSQPFLQRVERAAPPERVRLVLYYFDTCRAVTTQQATAFRVLDQLDAVGQRRRDGQLRRYSQFLRDTYAKNNPALTDRQRAELFLSVAARAEIRGDKQLAGVGEHFAGLYFYLTQEFGPAFQYLLSANNRFRKIGYANVPEIQRYLHELAFSYYHFNEDAKVVELLTEANTYPPFNANLHIQTYNTLAMAYARQQKTSASGSATRLAEQGYLKAYKLAQYYRDSVWMGITQGNLGSLYANQKRWSNARNNYRIEYRLRMQSAARNGYPMTAALALARASFELGVLDSCRFYLTESKRLHRLNRGTDYSKPFENDLFWRNYYETARLYYRQTRQLAEATRCADSLQAFQRRIDSRYTSRAAALAENQLLIKQHQAEVVALREGGKTQLWLGVGVAAAALIALGLGLLYRSSQRRRTQERLAHAQRQQQLEQENQQVIAERDQARADLARFLGRFQPTETTPDLTETNLLTADDWAEFRQRFERVYPFFFEQLHTQFTDLTPAEERLMALSKLNLDSLRMSQMLGISTESLRKSKYRMRKKFGLDGTSPLSELLQ